MDIPTKGLGSVTYREKQIFSRHVTEKVLPQWRDRLCSFWRMSSSVRTACFLEGHSIRQIMTKGVLHSCTDSRNNFVLFYEASSLVAQAGLRSSVRMVYNF